MYKLFKTDYYYLLVHCCGSSWRGTALFRECKISPKLFEHENCEEGHSGKNESKLKNRGGWSF